MGRKRSVKSIVKRMAAKGYLIETEDGHYTPCCSPPPREEKELREFWIALVQALAAKDFIGALEEEGFSFPEEE